MVVSPQYLQVVESLQVLDKDSLEQPAPRSNATVVASLGIASNPVPTSDAEPRIWMMRFLDDAPFRGMSIHHEVERIILKLLEV